ncbi:outer membrane porin [Synechococcus sp. MIT S9220]|uniref:iron uptake porin n=1 Tax=unclassified Synechococcus TaxID=2626047 RepID=UPI00164A5C1F|nr:iron uptake porin [Synechococcus sp. MIT S9220]NOL48512.1 iron uptake porin [Synechococcus sp. MIT S9220]QNJ24057.1 outer membrane porin [Synechococcus sp. MIT S9220]
MKLFKQLLVAPAALGLLAPMAAGATEVNVAGVSDYASVSHGTAASEQVTSINQFNDVFPTDWAYQALSNLIERYGCVAGYPNGTFRGNRAMTRFEAAALLNACLDRVTEVTDELKRLMKEFEKELAIVKGRVDGLEARVGELEATQFSTTTKMSGTATFVIGSNSYGGDAKVDKQFGRSNALTGPGGREKMSDIANYSLGATTFNYDYKLDLDTSFTGKDLLRTRIRTGNFTGTAFGFDGSTGISSALGGTYLTPSSLEVAFDESDTLKIDRLFYQFPVGSDFTITAGGKVRQDDMLAVWPSAYPSDTILDYFTYAGAPGAYSLNLGAGAGVWWTNDGFSISANYVSSNGNSSNPRSGGIATDGAAGTGTVQLAYADSNWGLAAAYNYSSKNWGSVFEATGTPLAANVGTLGNTNSFGLSTWWQPEQSGWVPSVSAGWGLSSTSGASDSTLLGYEFDSATSQSWYVGLQWSDVFLKGNNAGMAVGQQAFVTGIDLSGNAVDGISSSTAEEQLARDGQYAWEFWYQFQVTDNISVTPALFYLSRPLGSVTQGESFNQFGGLVKTTFSF